MSHFVRTRGVFSLLVAPRRVVTLAVLVAMLLVTFFPGAISAASFSARASLTPTQQYLNDTAGTLFTLAVRNSGTVHSIGAVQVKRPFTAWTIVACPGAPAGWTAARTANRCRYTSAAGTADDIQPGQTRSFTFRAKTTPGDENRFGKWPVVVSRTNGFANPSLLKQAAAMGTGLKVKVFSFQILDAVLMPGPATPGAACPAGSKSAVAASTGHTLVICGRNRTTLTLTPKAAYAVLDGTFIASHGSFSSGPVAPSTSSRVLGNWSNVTITSTSGSGKTVVARVGAASGRTSPFTTLGGYTALNSPPVVTTSAGSTAYTENAAATAVDPALTVTDADDATLVGARARISAGFVSATDSLQFTNQLGITGAYNSGTGVLTLTGTATVSDYQTALRSIKYANSSNNPTTSRTVAFRATDDGGDGAEATKNIAITAVNDAPTVTTSGGSASYAEDDAAVPVDPGLTITDPDSTQLTGATVSISSNFSSADGDWLTFTTQNGISGGYTPATGILVLSGTASLANYQTALRSITFSLTSDNPSTATRTVSFQVNDGGAVNNLSNVATRNITVGAADDPPDVDNSPGSLAYTENDPATAIDTAITITDPDSTNLTGATVKITGNYVNGQDVLGLPAQPVITAIFDAPSGTLTLSGTTTVAAYETALEAVTYLNTSDNPSTSPRTVAYQARDVGGFGLADIHGIAITAANDAPTVTTSGGSASYIEGGPAVQVDPGLTVTDPDSVNLSGATISITGNYSAADGDALNFSDTASITGVYSAGVLTLTGADTVANYQTALRSITFSNTDSSPGLNTATRTVSFQVNDGAAANNLSNIATRDVTVASPNQAPVVTTSVGSTAYTEGGSAVAIDGALTVADSDDTNLESGQVSITSGFQAGDVLTFANTASITGSYNSGTGVLTLSGTDTVANYEAALRLITFSTTNDNPLASKTVEFKVNDGSVDSNTPTKEITVTPVNDAPTVTTSGGSTAYTEGGAAVAVDGGLTVTDPDDTNLEGATVSITVGAQAGDTLGFSDTATITGVYAAGTLTLTGTDTVANYQAALRSITFSSTADDPPTSKTVSFMVSDGTDSSSAATKTIAITQVNDGPTNTAPASASTDEDTQLDFTGGNAISVSDPDSGAGELEIDLSVTNGTLTMTTLTDLTFGAGDGTDDAAMTFTGTLTDINNALATLSFDPTPDFPGTAASGIAAFSITSDDQGNTGGGALTDTEGFDITVNQVNDAPDAADHTLTTSSSILITIASGDSEKLKDGATDVDDPDGDLTVSATFTNVDPGADVTLTDPATGTYTYNPAAGFTGTDVFNYEVCDDAPLCGTGTVTVTVNGVDLWFVDDSAAPLGTGRLTDPFASLADLPGLRGDGDRIFVYSGTYLTGHTLNTGEHLIGQGASGSTFDTLLGVQVPVNGTLDSRPSLTGAGTEPSLANTVTLATTSKVQGVAIASTVNTALSGSGGLTGVDVSQTSLSTTTGTALSLNDVAGTIALLDLDKNGAGTGITLTNVGAAVTIPSGATIQATSTAAVDIDGGTGAFSYAGTISNVLGGTIEVTNRNGTTPGLVQFTGSVTGTGGTGVNFDNNDTGTITFSGGLVLSTEANAAFTATNGGTVNVTGTNTLTTTTGTALTVTGTTIGASGLTFQSINVDGNDTLPVNGILLNGTGSTAGLTVTGTGSAGTGGTIQDTSGNGIELIGTRAPSLSWMTVTSNLGNGIHGGDGTPGGVVTNATLADLTVSNNGNDSGTEDGILFQGLVGTATWSNLDVSGSARHNAAVINNTGTLTSLTISGSTIHDNAGTSSNGLTLIADGTAVMTVNVGTTNFTTNRVNGILGQTLTDGSLTLTVTGGTFTNNFISVEFTHASTGNMTGTFTGGTISNSADSCSGTGSDCGAPVNIFLSNQADDDAGSILRATVTNNTINNGGSGNSPGIWFHTGTPVRGHARLLITGNNISNVDQSGIEVAGGACISPQICDATVDATIENNTVNLPGSGLYGVRFNVGTAGITVDNNDTLVYCGDIENNTLSGGTFDVRLQQRSLTTIKLPGYAGSIYNTAAVETYLGTRNPASGGPYSAATDGAGGGFVSGTCAVP